MAASMQQNFYISLHKNVEFTVEDSDTIPDLFYTDAKRIEQIIKTYYPMHLNSRKKDPSLYISIQSKQAI